MRVHLLKSKLHRAQVTGASLHYEGSLTIARDLMELAGLQPYERILCSNLSNGERWETYVIEGARGTGCIELNGAVARLGRKGHLLTIMAFAEFDSTQTKRWRPKVILLGPRNKATKTQGPAKK